MVTAVIIENPHSLLVLVDTYGIPVFFLRNSSPTGSMEFGQIQVGIRGDDTKP